MTTDTVQRQYIDYENLGDSGTDTSSSIQPVTDGEPALAIVFARPSENIRSRTEIARGVLQDLLYYRDRTPRYLIELDPGGFLTWEVGGAGRVNNTTALTLRPFITPRTNIKGLLTVGTAGSNQLIYTVAPTAYATDGMNAISVQHLDVGGGPLSVSISDGPIYHLRAVYNSGDSTHDAPSIQAAFTSLIAGIPALTGKLVVTTDAIANVAVDSLAETPLDVRTHVVGTTGNATADVEAHTLALGALNAFTTTNPLAEGDLLAIRYDYVIEPGSASDDPKGGVPGGRAESNEARSNSDVSGNLFIAQDHPEWLPGSIPLCKVVNGNLHWIDGTTLASNSSSVPGSSLGSFVDGSLFSGLPTLVENGGIDDSVTTIMGALTSVDSRLASLRYATILATDGVNSIGGNINAPTSFGSTCSALATGGGNAVFRRGAYDPGFPNLTLTTGSLNLVGENSDLTTTTNSLLISQTANATVNGTVRVRDLAFNHTSTFRAIFTNNVKFESCAWTAGTFQFGNSGGARVELRGCRMTSASGVGQTGTSGCDINGEQVHVVGSTFIGPDLLASATAPCVYQGANVLLALYENCEFLNALTGPAFQFADAGNDKGTSFVGCYFRNASTTNHTLDIATTYAGGDITFTNCIFENTLSFCVLRVRNIAGHVRFVDCTFKAAGTASGTTALQQMVAANPSPAAATGYTVAQVSFENCQALVVETNFTGMTRALVEFGSTDSANTASGAPTAGYGRVIVQGFTLSLQGSSGYYSPATLVLLTGRIATETAGNPAHSGHVYDDVTIDVNDHRLPTTVSSLPYICDVYQLSADALQAVNRLRITGISSPQTDDTDGGVIRALRARLRDITTRAGLSADGNRFRRTPYAFNTCEVGDAQLALFNVSATIAGTSALYLGTSRLVRGVFSSGTRLSGSGFNTYLFSLFSAVFTEIEATLSVHANCLGVFLADIGDNGNVIQNNNLHITGDVPAFVAGSAIGYANGLITGNRVLTGQTAGAFANLGANPPTGVVVSNNFFRTSGATAAGCTPSFAPTADSNTAVILGNAFRAAIAGPN